MILNINTKDFKLSEGIRNAISVSAHKLERVFPRIHSCHYTVEIPHKYHHKGGKFAARIEMSVPGKEIVIKTTSQDNLYRAIQSAGDRAKRELLKYAAVKRGY